MEERNITVTLNKAKEWFNSGNATLKEIALQAFSEEELTAFDFTKIKTFEDALTTLEYSKSNKEYKEILIKDLCARLPYNVICQVEFKENGKYNSKVMLLSGIFTDEAYFTTKGGSIYSNEYKPYLFPLSSMTSEQLFEVQEIMGKNEIEIEDGFFNIIDSSRNTITYLEILAVLEWFYKNHFDINGLIEKGLAIDATGLNIY